MEAAVIMSFNVLRPLNNDVSLIAQKEFSVMLEWKAERAEIFG
jgi:hypothetical protein